MTLVNGMTSQLMDNQRLDDFLREQALQKFPQNGKVDYVRRFESIKEYLINNVYKNIAASALLATVKAGRKPIYLNNHGTEHVDQVICRASDLLGKSGCGIEPYESYILLTAILFHDVGNIMGRDEHERKCVEIMVNLGLLAGDDTYEKRVIAKIARAHGGLTGAGSKDTISQLQTICNVLGQRVRKRFLASILRFADELADDRSRASRFMLDAGLLEGSEAYHAYSHALHSVVIGNGEVALDFELDKKTALTKLQKMGGTTYLVDEIYQRTLQMHLERVYCMRFTRPDVAIERIKVKIEIFPDFGVGFLASPVMDPISYCLEDTGYPEEPVKIADLYPGLPDGETVAKNLT